ncbi:MAG: hypothetical protein GKR96_01810 [Gammaproteobacteria bacterium]|nr:hypothetical protein [Gammaproteobacteria bacterium]
METKTNVNRFFQCSMTLIIAALLTGCVTTNGLTQFPEFAGHAKNINEIDVVVDLTILYDLRGKDLGIDLKDHQLTMDEMESEIRTGLEGRGYNANFIFRGYGLSFEQDPDITYTLAEDGKSIDQPFEGFEDSNERKTWASDEMKQFYKLLTENLSGPETEITPDQIPQVVRQLEGDHFAYVRVNIGEVGGGKTAGLMIATGVLTAILTGGLYIHTSGAASNTVMDFSLVDIANNNIVWQNRGGAGKSELIRHSVVSTLMPLQNKQGVAYFAPTPTPDRVRIADPDPETDERTPD